MRSDISLPSLAAFAIAGFVLVASILLAGDPLYAAETGTPSKPDVAPQTCTCPNGGAGTRDIERPWPKPHFAEALRPGQDVRSSLDRSDEIAALEALHLALSEVGDGAAYVWQRHHGKLSGVVQPTGSFKDAKGRICRHIVVSLTSGAVSKRTETVACRIEGGAWQIDG